MADFFGIPIKESSTTREGRSSFNEIVESGTILILAISALNNYNRDKTQQEEIKALQDQIKALESKLK